MRRTPLTCYKRALEFLGLAAVLLELCSCAETAPLPAAAPEAHPEPAPPAPAAFQLPEVATKRDDIVETIFGVRVADPYRWLENGKDPEVVRWVEAQNERTRAALTRTGLVPALKRRLGELLEIGSVSLPDVVKSDTGQLRLFYRRREGRQNQPLLLWRDGLAGSDRTLLDVNLLSADGTIALDYFQPSPKGNLVAYGLSADGSEESTLRIRNVASGEDLTDTIPRTRYASVCWHADGGGFFYTRYPAPGSVPDEELHYHRRVYEHKLGDDPQNDPEVFGAGRAMTDYPACSISPDGRWLLVSVHVGWNRTDLFLADTKRRPLRFVELTEQKEHTYGALVRNEALYVQTNEGAPRYALYRVDPKRPKRSEWKLVMPEHASDVLDHFNVLGDKLIASYSKSAISRLERFDLAGRSLGPVPLPSVGSVDGVSGVHDEPIALYDFESFAAPANVHRLDLNSGEQEVLLTVATPLDPASFQVVRHTARSKDGTVVPYVVVSQRGVDLASGDNPTLLYGYGGFNISLRPRFSRTNYAFLEQGGVYVQANLRGGGEFGEAWHRAGQLAHKQNVFDDFIAVAEALVESGVTRPEKLAVYGRSNGGLLVAAAITQRPELFRAAVSVVPLTDMVRYPRFLMARLWTPEYGSPEDPDAFKWLYAYSPYHRVQEGTAYPATLFMTAESDTRVDPAHARKMAARLQAASSSPHPVLLRTDVKAGHGAGKPMLKVADEHADLYAFVLSELGMTLTEAGVSR